MEKIKDNPIFIIGIRRSGSTLWRRVLEKNGEIPVYGEMQYLWPWEKDFTDFLKKYYRSDLSDDNVKEMVGRIFSEPDEDFRFLYLKLGFFEFIRENGDEELKERISDRILKSDRSVGEIFKAFTEEATRSQGFNRYAVKFPVYFNRIHDLMSWYPNCMIVHISRDPRAIAVSKKNDPGGTGRFKKKYPLLGWPLEKSMMFFTVIQYRWSARTHKKYQHLKNYKLIHYEDLLRDPESAIKELCSFTGLEFNEDMLYPSTGRESSITGKKRDGIDKTSLTRWKDNITFFENKFITLLTRKSRKLLGSKPE
jgi:hypothetical protein